MIFKTTTDSTEIIQTIPLKAHTYSSDGVPFNYRSYDVYMTQAAGSGTVKVFPCRDSNSLICSMHTSFRGTQFTDIPCSEYSNGSWYHYNSIGDNGFVTPSQSYGSGYFSFNGTALESSYKSSKGQFTATINEVDTINGGYLYALPYAIIMTTNVSVSPKVRPICWSFKLYDQNSSSINALFPELLSEQYKTLASGKTTINGVNTYYKIIAIYAANSNGQNRSYQFSRQQIVEIGGPSLGHADAIDGDSIYFLEYGCEIHQLRVL